jgi:hypothetical protein
MDHNDATRLEACEKYLLGELPVSLRAEFEEHYFSCPVCAADLDDASVFLAASREILRQAPVRPRAELFPSRPKSWMAWLRPAFVVPAFAALLVLLGYQTFVVLPHWKSLVAQETAPQLFHPAYVPVGTARAALNPLHVVAGQPYAVFLDVPSDPRFQSYLVRFEDISGATRSSLSISASDAGKTSVIQFPSNLAPGDYSLVLLGLSSSSTSGVEITRVPFLVENSSKAGQH